MRRQLMDLEIDDKSYQLKVYPLNNDTTDISYYYPHLNQNHGLVKTFAIVDFLEPYPFSCDDMRTVQSRVIPPYRVDLVIKNQSLTVKLQPMTLRRSNLTQTVLITRVLEEDGVIESKICDLIEKIKGYPGLVPPYRVVLMERCDGNLKTFLSNVLPTLSTQQQNTCTLQFFGDMINALYTLHHLKLVHGDIKPENIGYKHDSTKQEYYFKLFDFDGLTEEGSRIRFISPTYSVYNYVRHRAELLHDWSAIVDTCLQFCRILTSKDHYMFHFTEKQQLENLLGRRIEYPAAGKVIDLILEAKDVPNDIKKALIQAVQYIQKQNKDEDFDEAFINRLRTQFSITPKR